MEATAIHISGYLASVAGEDNVSISEPSSFILEAVSLVRHPKNPAAFLTGLLYCCLYRVSDQ